MEIVSSEGAGGLLSSCSLSLSQILALEIEPAFMIFPGPFLFVATHRYWSISKEVIVALSYIWEMGHPAVAPQLRHHREVEPRPSVINETPNFHFQHGSVSITQRPQIYETLRIFQVLPIT